MKSPKSPATRATFRRRVIAWAPLTVLVLSAAFAVPGCIGSRYATKAPEPVLNQATQAIVARITAVRTAAQLPPATWVPELGPPATRAAMAVARGDQPLVAATRSAAMGGVTELGRHMWSFGADCIDPQQFNPPPIVTQQNSLLFATSAVPGPAGHHTVILLVAEPGTTALRAEQMGGGNGGSNPTLETYMHPFVASGACGQSWPGATRAL